MLSLAYLIVGIVAGLAGGFFGIGGGVIIVPALVILFGFQQHKAQGTSLVALLAPVGIFGLLNYYKQKSVDLTAGALIAAGFLVGAYGGSLISVQISDDLLRRIFAGFLYCLATYMLLVK